MVRAASRLAPGRWVEYDKVSKLVNLSDPAALRELPGQPFFVLPLEGTYWPSALGGCGDHPLLGLDQFL